MALSLKLDPFTCWANPGQNQMGGGKPVQNKLFTLQPALKYRNQQNASMVGRRNEKPMVSQSSRGPVWIGRQETARLENETFTWLNTKFVFAAHMSVQIRVLLDNQPLHVGEMCLPEWLCTKKGLYALDTFNNNLCVFCCLVVHKGAYKKNNLRLAGKWCKNILPHIKCKCKGGIAAYPADCEVFPPRDSCL